MGAVRDRRWGRLALASLGWTVALLWVAVAMVSAAEEPEYKLTKSFGPDGTTSTEFNRSGPIAIDQQTHIAYVLDRGTGILYKFDAEGNPVPFSGSAPYISGNKISGLVMANVGERQVAVDSATHEFYVTDGNSIRAFQASGEPALFSAGSGSGTNLIGGFDELAGLAVDANGSIYASEQGEDRVRVFASSGEEITQFTVPGEPRNLAVDSGGTVYVNRFLTTTLKYTPSSFPVTGATTYTPAAEPVSQFSLAVAVDPENDDVYVTHSFPSAKVAVYDKEGLLIATFAGSGEEGELILQSEGVAINDVSGKKGDTVFVLRFAGDFAPDVLPQVEIFDIERAFVGQPTIELTAASDVTADSATLHARINPNLAETTYWFEYGLEDCAVSACTKVPLDGAIIAEGAEPVPVSEVISGLQPGTTYHYLVVAENEFSKTEEPLGPDVSPDKTFTTQGDGLDFQLADSRVWEMVSPQSKSGAELQGAAFEGPIQAAADGNGIGYVGLGSVEADPDGNRAVELSSFIARRGASGWATKDLTPPSGNVIPLAIGQIYKLFTPDLSKALLVPRAMNPLSPDATERTPYVRENTEPASYTPLVTGKEGIANVPPGTVFGVREGEPEAPVLVAGGNAALSDVVLLSKVPLAVGAPPFALYHWRGGQLSPLSVLPASEGGAFIGAEILGSALGTLQGAVSEDGSRIFWSRGPYGTAGNGLTALFVRDTEAEETGRLDVVNGGSGAGDAAPVFAGASADGTVVYFTDTQQLTADASPSKADLYRCEVAVEAAAGCATLTNISGSAVAPGKSADVQGLPVALSEDGKRIYFAATGVLDAEPNPEGKTAKEGEPNLYLWEEAEGVRFIATLAEEDERDWGQDDLISQAHFKSASGSPDGRFLAFMSQESLTGEDNLDPVSGEPVERVFRYDAFSDELECISCDPSGGAPVGVLLPRAVLVDPHRQWLGRRVGAMVPQPNFDRSVRGSLYKPRAVLDSGRIFFNAIDPLVAADSNGEWDVYEYEPLGVGSCSASSGDAGTARSGAGCVSLISSGAGKEEVGFLDASTTGDDAFFLTTERLSAADKDDEADVYDARVNGIKAVLEPEAGCVGEGCRSVAPPPADSTPASAVFQGAGNVKEGGKKCPKGKKKAKRKGKVVCVPKKKPKKQKAKAKQQKQTSQSGRAGR